MISSENALIVIDMQQGLFRGPTSPHSARAVLSNICLLIAHHNVTQAGPFVTLATADNLRFAPDE